jgi:hypothetical protein
MTPSYSKFATKRMSTARSYQSFCQTSRRESIYRKKPDNWMGYPKLMSPVCASSRYLDFHKSRKSIGPSIVTPVLTPPPIPVIKQRKIRRKFKPIETPPLPQIQIEEL